MKYAYLPKVNVSRGAPYGRAYFNESPGIACRGGILPLAMNEGYDSGGAYWGLPNNVWVAQYSYFKKATETERSREFEGRVFVRAETRKQAIRLVNLTKGWKNIRFIQRRGK